MSIGSGNTINSLFGQGIHFTSESNFLRDYLFTRISLTDKTNQQRMELELRNMGGKQRQLLNERQRLLDNIARMTKSVQDTIQANINRESKEERADRKARSRDVARNTRRARSARDKAERDQRKAWEKAQKADSWGRDHFAENKSGFFAAFQNVPQGNETRIDNAQIRGQYRKMWQRLNAGPIDRPIEGAQKPGATFLHAYTALKARNPEAAKAFKQVVFQDSGIDPNMPVLATEGTGSWQALHLLHNDEDMFGVHLERVLSDPQYNVQRASSDPDAARQVGQDIAAEYDGNGDPQTARTRGIISQYQVRLAAIDAELKGLAEGRTKIIEKRFGRQSFSQLMTPYTYVSPQQEAALRVVAKMPEQERGEFLSDARMIIPSLRANVAPSFVEDNLLNEERVLEHRSQVEQEYMTHQKEHQQFAARAHHIEHQQEELKARLDAGEISEEEFGFRNDQLEGRRIDQQNRANRAQERMELSKILLQDLEFLTTGGGVASEWSRLPPAGRLRVIQGMNAREIGHADRLRVQISDARESVDSLEQEIKEFERDPDIGPRTSESFLKNPSANEALQELGRENEMLSSLLLQQNRWVQRAGESRRAVDYLVLNDPEYKVAAQSPDAALGVQGPIAEEVDFSAIDSAISRAAEYVGEDEEGKPAPPTLAETLDEQQAKEERFFRGEDGVPGLAEDEQFQSIREKLRRNQELSSEKAALEARSLELSVDEEDRLVSIDIELEGLSSDPELNEYFDWYATTEGAGDKDLEESVSDYAQFKLAEAGDSGPEDLSPGKKPEGLLGPLSRLPTSDPVGPPEELPAELDITPEGYIARGGTPDEFSPSDYLKRFISEPPENKQEAEDLRRFLYPSEDDRGGILEVQALSGADYNLLVEKIAPNAAGQFDVPMERQVFEEAPEPAIELEDIGPGLLEIDNLGNAPVTDASINAYINEMDRRTKDAILNASPENPASTALLQVSDNVADGYVNGGVAEEIWMTEQGRLQLAALQNQIEYYAHEDFQSGRINEADLDDNLRRTEGLGLLLEQTEQDFLSKTDAEPAAQEPAAQEPVTVDDDFIKPINLEQIEEIGTEPYQLTSWEQHMVQLRDAGQLTPKPGEDEGARKGREDLRASLEAIYKKRPDLMPSQAPASQPGPVQESRAPLNFRDIGDTNVLADEIGFRLEGAATASDTYRLIDDMVDSPVIFELGLTGRGREQLRKLAQHGKAQGPDSGYDQIEGFLKSTEAEFEQKLYEQMKPKEGNIQYQMTPEGVIEESDEDVLSSAMLGSRNNG
jgi:hypothetical protein